jgi:hypothetical protein
MGLGARRRLPEAQNAPSRHRLTAATGRPTPPSSPSATAAITPAHRPANEHISLHRSARTTTITPGNATITTLTAPTRPCGDSQALTARSGLGRLRSPRPQTTRAACAALRPASTRLEPASLLRRFNHWFTSVTPLRLAHWAIWWCWPASPSSRLLTPSPALPGSGCRQLHQGCCDSPTTEPFHLR